MKNIQTFSILLLLASLVGGCSQQQHVQQSGTSDPLVVIAMGDAGEPGSIVRDNAKWINRMYNGRHSGGKPDALIFLGDNFYTTGLNIPVDELQSKIQSTLGPYRETFEGLGRNNVFAIPGNHDYYARNILDASLLFGLVNIELGPTGLAERGSEREKNIAWWTYQYKMPSDVVFPTADGGKDSAQFVLFDSALPLRTEPSTWKNSLDSLRRLLAHSAMRTGIKWRILVQHHPWYSVGEHGGYSVWDDEEKQVTYLPNCDKDSNVVHWFVNTIDPQDLCSPKYAALLDSLKSVIRPSGVKMQLTLAGHEHNLQLLSYPDNDSDCPNCPKVHVVSGAGSRANIVRFPAPPNEFTASQADNHGESQTGFAQLKFESDKLRVTFFNSVSGEVIDMGRGKKEFWISRNGELLH